MAFLRAMVGVFGGAGSLPLQGQRNGLANVRLKESLNSSSFDLRSSVPVELP